MSQLRHIEVKGRVNGADGATLHIDEERGLAILRPKRERREYSLPLVTVAEMIVSRVVKHEMHAAGVGVPQARRGRWTRE